MNLDRLENIIIKLDNSANSAENNPPGYSVWVGGQVRGDTDHGAQKLNKDDKNISMLITNQVLVNGNLLTWYYSWGWYSGTAIQGPFRDGQVVNIPPVTGWFFNRWHNWLKNTFS